jgi:purine nucleosidase
MSRAFLIDTDTASDDAVALIMALRMPGVRVVAITTVAGNVPVERATRNALYVGELCGANVPVYSGCTSPLWRRHEDATWLHGQDGLGDQGYPPPKRSSESAHAVDAIVETVQSNPGIEIVTLGPLTNVALAQKREPGITENGNVTPAAEYNM